MAILRKTDLKNLQKNPKQIQEKMDELNKELMKLNAQRAVGTAIENPGRIRLIKRTIAKLHTINNQLENKSKEAVEKA